MEIVLIITGLGMGGAEKQVCLLADRFAHLGHRVTLFSLTDSAFVKPTHQSIKIIELGMKKTPFGFLCAYLKLRKLIKKSQPDVIHSHMFHANIMARLLRLTTKLKRLVCTAHSNNEGGKLRMLTYRLTNFLADINTNVSIKSVQAFIEQKAVNKGQMQAVYNGIDIHRFSPNDNKQILATIDVPDDKFIFIAVGRLTEAKDYPNLFNAMAILKNINPNFVILVVGDGELKVELQSTVQDLDLNKHIHFLGVRNDVPALMNASDAFVLPSAWEGFGLVVAEAMACEKPVVVTDCGGVAEVLDDCGLLVKPRDSKALAQAMLDILNMTQLERQLIGKKARQHILENFAIDNIVEQWMVIYEAK